MEALEIALNGNSNKGKGRSKSNIAQSIHEMVRNRCSREIRRLDNCQRR